MNKLILHLDDEPAIRELLAAALMELGYRVISVGNPTAALSAIGRDRPDLVITDLQLDEGDGLEIVTELRKNLPSVPIIILTGVLIDARLARKTIAQHTDAYLPKTSSLTKILDEVKRLLVE